MLEQHSLMSLLFFNWPAAPVHILQVTWRTWPAGWNSWQTLLLVHLS